MKADRHHLKRAVKSGRFVLTSERGEKISAVEGLTLSPRMAAVLRQGATQGLSGDERRALVLETLRRK